MRSDFFCDGYTETLEIEAEPGVHGALSIDYRPPTPEVWARLVEASDVQTKFVAVAINELPNILTAWTAKNSAGESVPPSREWIAKLHPTLLIKIANRAFGFVKGARDQFAADVKN